MHINECINIVGSRVLLLESGVHISFITSGAPLTNTSIVGLANFLTMTLILLRDDTNSNVCIIPNSIGGATEFF
jgi:hypothetical protein